jgi:hypothetical protein
MAAASGDFCPSDTVIMSIASSLDVLTISRHLGHGIYGHLFAGTDVTAAHAIEAATSQM